VVASVVASVGLSLKPYRGVQSHTRKTRSPAESKTNPSAAGTFGAGYGPVGRVAAT